MAPITTTRRRTRRHPGPRSGMQARCPHHRSMQAPTPSLSHHHAAPDTSLLPCHAATCSTRHDPVVTSTSTMFFLFFSSFFLINSNLVGHRWSRDLPPAASPSYASLRPRYPHRRNTEVPAPPCHLATPRSTNQARRSRHRPQHASPRLINLPHRAVHLPLATLRHHLKGMPLPPFLLPPCSQSPILWFTCRHLLCSPVFTVAAHVLSLLLI